jgi:hypothetical protein
MKREYDLFLCAPRAGAEMVLHERPGLDRAVLEMPVFPLYF